MSYHVKSVGQSGLGLIGMSLPTLGLHPESPLIPKTGLRNAWTLRYAREASMHMSFLHLSFCSLTSESMLLKVPCASPSNSLKVEIRRAREGSSKSCCHGEGSPIWLNRWFDLLSAICSVGKAPCRTSKGSYDTHFTCLFQV